MNKEMCSSRIQSTEMLEQITLVLFSLGRPNCRVLPKETDLPSLSAQSHVPALGCLYELIQTIPQRKLNNREKQGSKQLNSTGSPQGHVVLAWFMLITVLHSELSRDPKTSPCKFTNVGFLYSRFTRPTSYANKS